MLTLFFTPTNGEKQKVTGDTVQSTFGEAFKLLNCSTLAEFETATSYSNLCGEEGSFDMHNIPSYFADGKGIPL